MAWVDNYMAYQIMSVIPYPSPNLSCAMLPKRATDMVNGVHNTVTVVFKLRLMAIYI